MAFESIESAMVAAIYSGLGQAVSYVGQASEAVSIYAIVTTAAESYGYESATSEDVTRARIKVSDIATPRRGDRMVMADGTVYVVDSVDRENNTEWALSMTERDR